VSRDRVARAASSCTGRCASAGCTRRSCRTAHCTAPAVCRPRAGYRSSAGRRRPCIVRARQETSTGSSTLAGRRIHRVRVGPELRAQLRTIATRSLQLIRDDQPLVEPHDHEGGTAALRRRARRAVHGELRLLRDLQRATFGVAVVLRDLLCEPIDDPLFRHELAAGPDRLHVAERRRSAATWGRPQR
jgi:hypothetical protein